MTPELAAIALAIAASPFPIIPAILLLFTPRPRTTTGGFLLGWVLGIIVATTAFAAVMALVEPRDETPAWVSWTRISLGVLLILVGVWQWATRRAKESAPAWMKAINDATPASALRLGLLLSGANPKVLLLTAAGGLESRVTIRPVYRGPESSSRSRCSPQSPPAPCRSRWCSTQ